MAGDSRLNTVVRRGENRTGRAGYMDVDFYRLERPVQDRFADATRSIGLPTPILREPARDFRVVGWILGTALALFALVWTVSRDFGALERPLAIAPSWLAFVYSIETAAIVLSALRAAGSWNARSTLPYRPGLYLFPVGVIDARTAPLRVFRHPALRDVAVTGSTALRITVDGGAFVFRLPDAATAEQAKGGIMEARRQYEAALDAKNRREEAMLDPLVDSGFSSPFSPRAPITHSQPAWVRATIFIALGIGVVLGPLLWKIRNAASEKQLYTKALDRNDAASYREYIARGGHRPEARDILLPRAELRSAMAEKTVEALEQFAATHANSKIQGEIDAAIRVAVDADLNEARNAGTVTALRELETRRSAYKFINPAIEVAKVELFRKAATQFAEGKDATVASFFERLLGYTKTHGPRVAIRFVRRTPDSVEMADQQVLRSAYFMGKQSLPSQYFLGDYAVRREATAAKQVMEALNPLFPPDIFKLEQGDTQTEPGPVPAPTEPTIYVEYLPEMSGGYMSPKPRGVFVGVGMMFRTSFRIPGDGQPLESKYSFWRMPNAKILEGEGATVADVYEKMATDGFDKFVKGFTGFLLGKPS
jgi:hypothetical protein